jgi:hypothetical protein
MTKQCPSCGGDEAIIAPEIHYCDGHHSLWLEFVSNGGVKKVLENVVPFK